MSSDFETSIAALIAAMNDARDPWFLIGGAAAALVSGDHGSVRDIDLVCSPHDARRLIDEHGFRDVTDGGRSGLRSAVRAQADTPILIDALGGFEILIEGRWTAIAPNELRPIEARAGRVYLPGAAELHEIRLAIGRARGS
jgi:hypothetical protein